ncbi:hypothetical protein F0562_019847 [Nyssa sinensis]|uniref:Major facilitator superfamily (MFS) profile domain-containing protein n=1 Tax=Nyssa sinensis TaxID=561372 RepID=A0A5J5BQY7_9ASTE|nr:hypothetical protein F0562_019847 [Nyssa sinensis]
MEEGLETWSLLAEQKPGVNSNVGQHGGVADGGSSSSSSATAVVVLSTFVTCCGSFAYGCAYGYSSPAEFGIMYDLGLSTAEYSVFGSILTIGGVLGALISGTVADLIGRRGTMWFFQTFCIMGWLAIVFAKDIGDHSWWLDFGRLSLGFGFGLHGYLAPVYIAEIAPKNTRGGFTAAIQLTACCGLSLMFFTGTFMHWRPLALIGTIPCLVQVVGVFFIPESPRWLAKCRKEKEVEASLQRLRGNNVDISQEAADIKDYTESFECLSESRFLDLFQWKYAHSLIVGVGLMSLVQFGGTNGISYYASSIFKVAGTSTSIGTTTMAIIQIPFSALSILLMDKLGRRPLLMITAAGAFFGSALTGLAFLLQDLDQRKEIVAILVFTGIVVYSAAYSMGLASTPWVIMSEIFPINIKGSAGSLVNLANYFSAWIVSYAFNFLFEWSSSGVFFIFASICCSIPLFVAMLVPETKGRTLEEIQASIT